MAECSYRSISLTWCQATYEAKLVFFLKRVNIWERSEFLLLPVYGEVRSSRGLPKDVCHGLLYNVDRRASNSRQTNKNLETWMLISKEELNKLSCSRTTEHCIRPTEILIDLHVPGRASSQRHLCQWRTAGGRTYGEHDPADGLRYRSARAGKCMQRIQGHTPQAVPRATPRQGNGRQNR